MLFGVLAYAALGILPYRVETSARAFVREWGFYNPQDIKARLKNNALYLTNLSFDEEGFSVIQRINVPYTWRDALNPGLPKIIVNGMHLTATLENDGQIKLSGIQNEEILALLYKAPVSRIEFKSGKIDLFSSRLGGILINFDGEILRQDDGTRTVSFSVNSAQKQFNMDAKILGRIINPQEAQLDVEVLSGKWDLAPVKVSRVAGTASAIFTPGPVRILHAQLTAGAANLYGIPWQDANISIDQPDTQTPLSVFASGSALGHEEIEAGLTWHNGNLSTSFHAPRTSQIRDYLNQHGMEFFSTPPQWLESIEGPTINLETPDKKFFAFTLSDKDGNFNIDGSMSRLENGTLKGKFTMEPAMLAQVTDMFFHGTMIVSGDFSQEEKSAPLDGSLNIRLRDGVWRYGNWRFEKVGGSFAYQSLQKPETAKPVTVTFALPLAKDISQRGNATVSHKMGSAPVIHDLQVALLGGMFKAENPNKKQAMVTIIDLDLSKLSAAMKKQGLSMSGKMQGALPLALENKRVVIKDAVLRAQGKGVLKFTPETMPAFLSGDDLRREATRAALSNYHYDDFEIKLSGDPTGEVDVILTAQGHNPDQFAGRPVAIDLRFKASLPAIFSAMLAE